MTTENPEIKSEVPKKDGTKASPILIVEDDQFLGDLLVAKFEGEGFSIEIARDGESGIQKARDIKPAIILLDLLLPHMSGFDVLKQVREDPAIGATPVIILSNLGNVEDQQKGLSLGATSYMVKAHYTPTEIVQEVKEVLRNSSSGSSH